MAGSHESNPNLQKASSSKKSKGSGNSGNSGKSGKSGKNKKRVQFAEEPSSKRQRVEDDYSEYILDLWRLSHQRLRTETPIFSMGSSWIWKNLKIWVMICLSISRNT